MGFEDEDAVYFRMREQQERDLAEKATVREVRRVHQTLADKYHSLAAKAERRDVRGIENVAIQVAPVAVNVSFGSRSKARRPPLAGLLSST